MSLAERIKSHAIELGFQKAGICPAEAPDHLPALADWLAQGNHGTMAWMERTRDKRLDIRKVLHGVRSVVVVGMNYYSHDTAPPQWGRVSSYARGRDYHDVLTTRLQDLQRFIGEACPDARTKIYSDTGPVSEKVWAEKAGLGWQGKHSNLLSADYSSWLFLGVVLADIELEYDLPASDHCGTCTRCIEACPTDAITEPYVVDSRRCISYLNIELRGPIPAEWRSQIGDWIYGCDICQDVCPWNRFARESQQADFRPLAAMDWDDPSSWLELTLEEFRGRLQQSAMKRAKWSGLLRNVAVVLGNSGDLRHVPALIQALQHPEALVRGHAAWALGRLGSDSSTAALRSRLEVEPDEWVREELEAGLCATD